MGAGTGARTGQRGQPGARTGAFTGTGTWAGAFTGTGTAHSGIETGRQMPNQRPIKPHCVMGQKILHPRRPHGCGAAGEHTGTGTGAGTGKGTGTGTGTISGAGTGTGTGTGTGAGAGAHMRFGPPAVLGIGPTQRLRSFGHLWSESPTRGLDTPTSVDTRPPTVNVPPYDNNSNTVPLGATNAIPPIPLTIGEVKTVV
jgi:hypothetical protein